MEYGAIDLHLRRSQVRIIDDAEQVVFDRRIDTTREDFTAVFGGRARMRILLESSTESEWVAQHLETLGHEAVVVSHQLPIWTTRLFLEKRSYLHHPKNRQCTLCSLTSVVFDDDKMVQLRYSEPAGDLIPVGDRSAPFSAGGAAQEDRP